MLQLVLIIKLSLFSHCLLPPSSYIIVSKMSKRHGSAPTHNERLEAPPSQKTEFLWALPLAPSRHSAMLAVKPNQESREEFGSGTGNMNLGFRIMYIAKSLSGAKGGASQSAG